MIALIQANKDDESRADAVRRRPRPASSSNLAGRIDDLESRVDDLPTSDDVSKLDGRIKERRDEGRQHGLATSTS